MPQKKGLPQSVMNAVSGGPLHSKQGYFDPEKYQLQEEVTVTGKIPSSYRWAPLIGDFSQAEALHKLDPAWRESNRLIPHFGTPVSEGRLMAQPQGPAEGSEWEAHLQMVGRGYPGHKLHGTEKDIELSDEEEAEFMEFYGNRDKYNLKDYVISSEPISGFAWRKMWKEMVKGRLEKAISTDEMLDRYKLQDAPNRYRVTDIGELIDTIPRVVIGNRDRLFSPEEAGEPKRGDYFTEVPGYESWRGQGILQEGGFRGGTVMPYRRK